MVMSPNVRLPYGIYVAILAESFFGNKFVLFSQFIEE